MTDGIVELVELRELEIGDHFRVPAYKQLLRAKRFDELGCEAYLVDDPTLTSRWPLDTKVERITLIKVGATRAPDTAASTIVAPPDSELPTYDEVMGALGDRWTVCCESFGAPIPTVVARSHQGTGRAYPGPWLLYRDDGPPYLHLQRDDGQRVRFEVRWDWRRNDTLLFLQNVARGYRAKIPDSPYALHVRWLPESDTRAPDPPHTPAPASDSEHHEKLPSGVLCRSCKKRHAGPSGQCLSCRWPGLVEGRGRLERLLAEQVASGGQDCAASRRLLVMREKLLAEERERAKHLEERRVAYRLQGSRHRENRTDDLRSPARGIRDDLPRPFIAYKRRWR